MATLPDYYAILGVRDDATGDEIRSAFRTLTHRLHPDVNSHPGASAQYRDVNMAYTVLSDAVDRQLYNDQRKASGITSYFTVNLTTSQQSIPMLDESQVMYVHLEIMPRTFRNKQISGANVNLTLILDQSTSMKGTRLERVKMAAHGLIDQLGPDDIFSLVTFSDAADVLWKAAPMTDKAGVKAQVSMMQAFGATELLQGMIKGLAENQRYASKKYVNHVIVLTDGRTFGDEQDAIELAEKAHTKDGIGVSAIGIGDDWNDTFLDQLASRTGGTSEYIQSPQAVGRFLTEKVRALGQAFSERTTVSLAPDPGITIESAFRIMPSAQPLEVDRDPIPLGTIQLGVGSSVLLQLGIGPIKVIGKRSLLRVDVTGDIMREQLNGHKVIAESAVNVVNDVNFEEPPAVILEALNKLTYYRLQERAKEALAAGDVKRATTALKTLATRLFAAGETELAQQAAKEADHVAGTNSFSSKGQKELKYGTRMLLEAPDPSGTSNLSSASDSASPTDPDPNRDGSRPKGNPTS